jgi:hypothetical protein
VARRCQPSGAGAARPLTAAAPQNPDRISRILAQLVTELQVRDLFKKLEAGDGSQFFAQVAEHVNWTVEGTHPLAGHYHCKADFLARTFEKLSKVLPSGCRSCPPQ